MCQHQLKAKLLEAAGKEQSEAEAVQACRFLGCFVGVIILGVFIIVGVFLCLLLFKGVHQEALFFVVFRVWLCEDFEGCGVLFFFGGREQSSSGGCLAACLCCLLLLGRRCEDD